MSDRTELERLLAEWHEQGDPAGADAFIAAHPEHADALRKHLGMLDLVAHAFDQRSAIPDSFGPFRIEHELGAGGMGTVYRAVVAKPVRGIQTGRTVALKVVHPHLFRTAGFFKRFLREAELGRRIDHPNVVRTLDADAVEVDDRPQHYLVMEYVEGQTLRDLMEDVDRVPEELARHVGCEVAKALSAIHAAGAVHRDLKPENVLITPDHEIKVMDLGVARLTDEAVRLSQTGAFVGSLQYAAPEQFGGGKHVDSRADLHGLGVLLYEIATGTNPYTDEDARVVMRRILTDTPRKLGELNSQLSPFFEEVVAQLLAKAPGDRFDSADDVLAILDAAERSDWWRARAREIRAVSKRPLRRIRVPRETAVYGRDAEIAQLRRLYEAVAGGDGRVLLIEGEAGIGKTRLVDEFVARLQQDGEEVNFLFASYPPGGAATASGAFSAAYREHLGRDHLDEALVDLLPQTPILIPAFAALLRGDAAPEAAESLTKGSLQTCFAHLTRSLAAERTTIVLIDDLHFAPEEGRALFTSLALGVPGHRILVVGTMRPGVPQDWIAGVTRLEQTSHLTVPRLGPKDLVRLLSDSFRSERLAEELSGKIAVKSDGNPFFVFEIIRGLREGQFITQRRDGSWHTTRLVEDIQVPSSVLDLVNARVADLVDDDRNLLDAAACWGYEFDPSLVAAAIGQPRLPVLQRLAKIEKRDRLVRSVGRCYAFDHHQVQEALYGALNEQLREEYHAALAAALEGRTGAAAADPASLDGDVCVRLCEHYLAGARGESGLRYLSAAQTHLTNGYLHAQVVALSEHALAVPSLLTGTERATALLRLSRALDAMGRRARQEECVREAERLAEEAGDDQLRGTAVSELGSVLRIVSRSTEAEAACRRALELALARGDPRAEASAVANLGLVLWSGGRLREARELHERHRALSRQIGHRVGEAGATVNLGLVLHTEGRLREALEHTERGRALCREIGHRRFESNATGILGNVFHDLGRLREAREHHERHLALSREIGDRVGEANATGNLGRVFSTEGRLREAREHMERQLVISGEIGYRTGEAGATLNLGNVLYSEGRLREAREHHEQHLALCRAIGDRAGEAIAHHNLGQVLRQEGNAAPAEERLILCLALSEEIGDRYLTADTRLVLGSLRVADRRSSGHDWVSGQESLVAARDLAAEHGFPGVETLARCELALLPGGDAEDALAAFAEHGERLAAEERRAARLLLYRATGDRAHIEEAKRLLDQALSNVPAEDHESMCTNLCVNRDILAAWREETGED